MAVCLLAGCSDSKDDKAYTLQGAWVLQQMDRPVGYTEKYSETTGTQLRLYDGDSVMYQCRLTRTKSGLIIRPIEQTPVRLIDKGHGEHLYLEGDDPRPLTVADDSTLVIQHRGGSVHLAPVQRYCHGMGHRHQGNHGGRLGSKGRRARTTELCAFAQGATAGQRDTRVHLLDYRHRRSAVAYCADSLR